MSDETRTTYGRVCPESTTCTWFVAGLPVWAMAQLEVEWHLRSRHPKGTDDGGLTCDPPRVPLPRTRDLTLTGITEAVARAVWRWVR